MIQGQAGMKDLTPIQMDELQKRIYTLRGVQVMLDQELAELYGVETRVLNQAVITICTKTISNKLEHDVKKYNAQYTPVNLKQFSAAHDRFLILDEKTVYHIGASLKDLGKKWFAFSKLHIASVDILNKLKKEGVV